MVGAGTLVVVVENTAVVVTTSVNVVADGVTVKVSRVVYVMLKKLVVVVNLNQVGTAAVPVGSG